MADTIHKKLPEYKVPTGCVIQFESDLPLLQASLGYGEGEEIIDTGDD